MNRKAMFSSCKDDWETPWRLFDDLDKEFGFDLDVCATEDNAKCKSYFTKEQNGLTQEWRGTCWMNPPYGRSIGKWMQKASESAEKGFSTVVCLVPAMTDTAWWHDYAMKGEIRFNRGRVRFEGAKENAPFPSAVVIFRRKND